MMDQGMMTGLLVLGILIVFPIFFSALWILITLIMSHTGGWHRLAKVYAARERPITGRMLRRVTGMFGMARYKKILTVVTTDTGIYLQTAYVFRFAHPALFIPFTAIRNAERITLFYWEYIGFEVDYPAIATIRLPSKVFEGTPVAIVR